MRKEVIEKLEKWVYSNDFTERVIAATAGFGLDILINDEDPFVRLCVNKYLIKVNKAVYITQLYFLSNSYYFFRILFYGIQNS